MSITSHATQQKFPFGYDLVFDGLAEVIPKVGLDLKNHDKVIGRLTASAGMSLFSWGENLTVVAEKIDENNTLVAIESALKLGANLAGAHRHQKNFDQIISALSQHLQRKADSPSPVHDNGEFACPHGVPIGVWSESMMKSHDIRLEGDCYVWNGTRYASFRSVIEAMKGQSTTGIDKNNKGQTTAC